MSVEVNQADTLAVKDVKRAGVIVWLLINNPVVSYWEERIGELEELVSRNNENINFLIPLAVFNRLFPRGIYGLGMTKDQESSLRNMVAEISDKYNYSRDDTEDNLEFYVKSSFIGAVIRNETHDSPEIYSLLNDCSFDLLKEEHFYLFDSIESYFTSRYHYHSLVKKYVLDTLLHKKGQHVYSKEIEYLTREVINMPVATLDSSKEGFLLLENVMNLYQKNGYGVYEYMELMKIVDTYNYLNPKKPSYSSTNIAIESLRKYCDFLSTGSYKEESNIDFPVEEFLKMPIEWQWSMYFDLSDNGIMEAVE